MPNTKTSHTPGPWALDPGPNDGGLVRGADKKSTASVHFQEDYRVFEANARLIAAAPALLEAAQMVVLFVVAYDPDSDAALQGLVAAIRQAQGEVEA